METGLQEDRVLLCTRAVGQCCRAKEECREVSLDRSEEFEFNLLDSLRVLDENLLYCISHKGKTTDLRLGWEL